MLELQVEKGHHAIDRVADAWTTIRQAQQGTILEPDVTCSPAWSRALSQTLLRGDEVVILSALQGQNIVGICPLSVHKRTGIAGRREARLITEAYSGRSGICSLQDDREISDFLVRSAISEVLADVTILTVIEGSNTHRSLLSCAGEKGGSIKCISETESPYVCLTNGWEDLFGSLPKKMRWTIRKSERDLQSIGELSYRAYETAGTASELIEAIYDVERHSWKEEAGSSITVHDEQMAFYEALIPIAAEEQMLSAHVLYLDNSPIAYILGLASGDGVFLDLKESFHAEFSPHSPGHVLKRFAMPRLISQGVRIYDFMGNCEPYKMRWTDRTYRTLTFAVYHRTLRGTIARLRSVLRSAN